MTRLAVLVGCNYPNLLPEDQNPGDYSLHGCINDVNAMKTLLISRFEFDESNIELLTDEPISALQPTGKNIMQPTGENIMQALNQMIDKAAKDDVLFFHFSGHGTQVPKIDDANQYDAAIVPSDLNLITSVDLRELVGRVPSGATFTFLADSSYSGGLFDGEKEQIGPIPTTTTTETSDIAAFKPKFMPLEAIVESLKSRTGNQSSDIGTLFHESFGDKASIKFRLQALLERINRLGVAKPDGGILLGACQADEVARETVANAMMYGAFSNAVQIELDCHKWRHANWELSHEASKRLWETTGLKDQHPRFYGSDSNVDVPFLREPENPPEA